MSAESVEAKADRYLVEGRVAVVSVQAGSGSFTVKGSDKEPYAVTYDGDWKCDCPARVMHCAHVEACQRITRFSASGSPTFNQESELTDLLKGIFT